MFGTSNRNKLRSRGERFADGSRTVLHRQRRGRADADHFLPWRTPHARCRERPDAPVIDGVLDDAVWRTTPAASAFLQADLPEVLQTLATVDELEPWPRPKWFDSLTQPSVRSAAR